MIVMMMMQEWCEALATVIWSTRQHVKDLERLRSSLPDSSTPPVRLTDQSELRMRHTDQYQTKTHLDGHLWVLQTHVSQPGELCGALDPLVVY